MTRRALARSLAAALVLSLVGWFVWPTPYRALALTPAMPGAGVVGLRVHRLTGRVDMLVLDRGWVRVRSPYERAKARVEAEARRRRPYRDDNPFAGGSALRP